MAATGADTELLSEVIAVCNDLGHKTRNGDNKYILNKKEGKSVVRELIRFLRHDDKYRFPVRKQLGITNLVANDLIPIVEQHSLQDIQMFDLVLRLLVDLTNPSILLFQQKMPTEKQEAQNYLELQSVLYTYKQAFASHKRFWTVVAKHLSRIIQMDDLTRQVEDTTMFERILVLIRNILHIPIDTNADRTAADDEMNPHDRVVELMSTSGINELIIFLSNDDSHQEFCFHLIEIISLMFREQSAEFIAKSVANSAENDDKQRCDYERDIDRQELKELKARDLSARNQVPKNFNRFNGTYFVKNLKSISDRDQIYHKPPESLHKIDFDSNKCSKRKHRIKQPMADSAAQKSAIGVPVIHRSAPKIRKILFDFCVNFLNNYNQFMSRIKDNLNRNMSQENDETYYLWAIQFFMEFFRCNPKMTDHSLLSETMSGESFHFLRTQIDHYLDNIHTKKQRDEIELWSKRLHYGLKAYRELLFSLNHFEHSRDEVFRMRVKGIKNGIFYEEEYRDLLQTLLQNYNEAKMSKTFLKDLVETNHVFLKMLESYYKTNSRLTVRRKVKSVKRKKPKKKTREEKTPPEDIWTEIMSTVSEALQGSIDLPKPEDDVTVRAFDSTSEKPIDEQKMEVLRRVHSFLAKKSVAEAVALYRDARSCWSGDDDNAFGAPDIPLDEEMLSLNEVLMTDFPDDRNASEDEEEGGVDEELVDEESTARRTKEIEINLSEVVHLYCNPLTVTNLGLLLRKYEKNSDQTNHCLAKLLHRIGFDCKMHAMLFQASLFRTFQRILNDPMRNASPTIKELANFAKFIVGKFVVAAQNNKKIFVEILFWKRAREATEIEEGYNNPSGGRKQAKVLWSEEQILELEVLFNEFKDKAEGDKDYIDLILEKIIDESKTRRQIIRQLKQMNLFIETKKKTKRSERKNKPKKKKKGTEEGNDLLNDNEIVEQFTDSDSDDNLDDLENEIIKELNSMKEMQNTDEDQELNEQNIDDYTQLKSTPKTNNSSDGPDLLTSNNLEDNGSRELSVAYESESEEEIVFTTKRKRQSLMDNEEKSNSSSKEVEMSFETMDISQSVNGIERESDESADGLSNLVIDERVSASLKTTQITLASDFEDEQIVSQKKKRRKVVLIDDDDD